MLRTLLFLPLVSASREECTSRTILLQTFALHNFERIHEER